MKDFASYTKTSTGVEVKNLRYNAMANIWLGVVYDRTSVKWMSCAWKISGKCINRNRTDLDLK